MAQDKKNEGAQYVVDGAIYKCQYGSAPCQIGILSNQKIMAEKKAMVTDKDVTFKLPTAPFVNCSMNPNTQAPVCTYANGIWSPNTTLQQGKKNAITEDSKMKCPMFGGEISCVFAGQVQSVASADLSKPNVEALSNFPFAYAVTFPPKNAETTPNVVGVNSVSVTDVYESKYVRSNDLITLRAFKKKNKVDEVTSTEYVNWAVSTRKIVEEEVKDSKSKESTTVKNTYLDTLVLYKMVCSPFNLRLDAPGIYYIEAGSDNMVKHYTNVKYKKNVPFDCNKPIDESNKLPADNNCQVVVEVLEFNRILDISLIGDYAKEEIKEEKKEEEKKKEDLYYVKKTDKVSICVRTALPIDGYEVLRLMINYNLRIYRNLLPSKNTTYKVTLEPSFFNNNITKTVGVLLYAAKKDVILDSSFFRIKVIDGYVSANITLEGNVPIQKDSCVRPRTPVFLTVQPTDEKDKITDLENAIWKIQDKYGCKNLYGKTQQFVPLYEGDVTITLDLSKCDSVINSDNKALKQTSLSFKVLRNKIEGVNSVTPTIFYPGIPYSFKFDCLYKYEPKKDGSYECILDATDEMERELEYDAQMSYDAQISNVKFNVEDVGNHSLYYYGEKTYNFQVKEAKIDKWQFVDERGVKVNKVGIDEPFFLDINIPVWGDYQKNVRNSNESIGKIIFFLLNSSTREEKPIATESLKDARFDGGKARICLKITEKELGDHYTINFNTSKLPKKINLTASLVNPPSLPVNFLSEKSELKGHWTSTRIDTSSLTLTTVPEISGFFSGKSGNPQKSVMKYGDTMYIMLFTHNYKDKKDKLTVELVENNQIGSEEDKTLVEFKDLNFDDSGKVKIDISDQFKDESAHGENPNPRLFYFRVKLDGNVIYQYPQTQADVFNMKFKKRCESAAASESQSVLSGEQPPVQNDEQNTEATQRPEINGGRDANMPHHRQEGNGERNMGESRRAMLNNEQREEVHQRPMQDAPQNTDASQQTTTPTDSQTVPSTNAPQQTEQECDDSDTAVITQDDGVYTISKGDTSCDDNLKLKVRSYLWQLKVDKDKEVQRLNSTLAIIAPVVVGEKLTEGERNNDESQSACKNCHEEYELMAKRLKEVFDKVDENKLKIIAQAYCDYQYKLCMDSCWAKAVFFAAVYVESGPNLTIRKGEGFNYSVANLYYSGTFSRFKGNPSLCVEYGATNTSSCFKYTPSNKDIDTASFSKIDSVVEEGITSYKFKKDYIGKDKWDDKIHSHSCDSKKLANYVYSDRKDLGNKGGDDGWNFRGRGLCQITGRGAYTSIQNIMRSVGYNVDLENNPDLVVNDIRVATVSSMAFFVWKGLNMRNICDEYVDKNKIDFKKVGDDSDVKHGIDIVTRKMGNNPATSMKIKVGDENVSLLRNHRGKHLVFKDLMFEAFDLKNCQCKSVRTDETDIITYHIYSNRRIEKHIPLNITNKNIYRYVYHTEKASYLVAERKIIRDGFYFNANPVKVEEKNRKNTELIYTYNKKLKKIDGKDVYVKYRSNGVPEYVIVNAKDGSDFPDYLYRTDGRHTEVVRIDEVPKNSDEAIVDVVNQPGTLSFYVENEVFISYRVDLTQTERCYTNPTIMAIAIGILAEYGATKLTEVAKLYKDAYNSDKSDVRPVYSPHSYCRSQKEDNTTEPNFTFEGKFCRSGTGNVDKLGTGFPSQTHRNGMAFDFCYGKKSDDEKIIEIAKGYGFQNILCGTRQECQRKGAKNDTNHNNHIHLGGLKYYKVNRDSKGDLIITKEGAISRTPILCGPLDDKPWGLANYVEIKEKEEVKNEK